MTPVEIPNVNKQVLFNSGHLPELLRKLENYLGVALSLRSNTGEVVCKTNYFQGPCSVIRGTERGRSRCRKTYKAIEDRLFRRKAPFVNVCYAGFLIFAVPLELRGEMIGTLLGSQILPVKQEKNFDLESFFGHTAAALQLKNKTDFYKSFSRVKTLSPDFERITFMHFLEEIGKNFVNLALAECTWDEFLNQVKAETPNFGKL